MDSPRILFKTTIEKERRDSVLVSFEKGGPDKEPKRLRSLGNEARRWGEVSMSSEEGKSLKERAVAVNRGRGLYAMRWTGMGIPERKEEGGTGKRCLESLISKKKHPTILVKAARRLGPNIFPLIPPWSISVLQLPPILALLASRPSSDARN